MGQVADLGPPLKHNSEPLSAAWYIDIAILGINHQSKDCFTDSYHQNETINNLHSKQGHSIKMHWIKHWKGEK